MKTVGTTDTTFQNSFDNVTNLIMVEQSNFYHFWEFRWKEKRADDYFGCYTFLWWYIFSYKYYHTSLHMGRSLWMQSINVKCGYDRDTKMSSMLT